MYLLVKNQQQGSNIKIYSAKHLPPVQVGKKRMAKIFEDELLKSQFA
jgi:hypothetical protein